MTSKTNSSPWKITDDGEYVIYAEDPEGWYSARCKWDGCVDFSRYFNLPMHEPSRNEDDEDSLHICELDDFITELTALRDLLKTRGFPRDV